jgi:hypothetical protein
VPDLGVTVPDRGVRAPTPLGAGVIAGTVAVVSFFYRFNALGGAFGGFTNDHFIHLSRARQILAGELPFRDFSDPGAPLTSGISALVQWLGGHNLFGEALLTIGAISLGAGMTVWLAARVTGRTWPALLVGLLQVGIGPRLYNYPKILLTACGIWLAWRYIDVPRLRRLTALAAAIAVGFLIRHDYAIYLGALGALTVVLAHRDRFALAILRTTTLALLALVLVMPFFVFLERSGGVVTYVRQSAQFARADTQRTSFRFPVLDLRLSAPVASLAAEEPPPPTSVNVRWVEGLAAEKRSALERTFHLVGGEHREGTTWTYELADHSTQNIEALVKNPAVLDTHGVNRATYTLNVAQREGGVLSTLARVDLAPELTNTRNAVAWLYYTLVALPVVSAVAWMLRRRSKAYDQTRMRTTVPYIWPVIVLMGLLAVGFLSRGTIDARVADVSVPAGILAAWLLCPARERVARVRSGLLVRGGARAAAVFAVVTVGWSTAVAGAVRSTADRSGFFAGFEAVSNRARLVSRTLRATPPVDALTGDADTPFARLARWVNRCTGPDDRVLVVGNMPELYFFSGRLIAGGHVWFVPGYGTAPAAQQDMLARLRPHSVPLVITETERYDTHYRPEFRLIDAYISEHYRPIGTLPFGEGTAVRLMLSQTARWEATDAGTGLPCGQPASTR